MAVSFPQSKELERMREKERPKRKPQYFIASSSVLFYHFCLYSRGTNEQRQTNQKARIIGGHLKGLTQVINNDFKVTSIKAGFFRA